jgi:chromosome segregation ATPase
VSAEPSAQVADWNSVRRSLAEICASHDEFDRFFSGMFDQLNGLAGELVRRQRAWLSERQESESQLERRAAELEEQRAAIVAKGQQVGNEIRENAAQAAASAESHEQLKRMLQETEQQRAAMLSAQEVAQTEAARLADLAEQLSETRNELAEARREIQRQREELKTARADADQHEPDGQLKEQLGQMGKERAEWDQQRVVLEAELDAVRNRAAEMAETVAVQRRQLADERAQWTGELKRMRRLMEAVTNRRAEQDPAAESHQVPANSQDLADLSAESTSKAAAEDSVLHSVMAQFEMLQKDLARRRKKTAQCH